ncbi:hypothetical protein RRG08_040495 [Elysia crispata]|uniref:Uncharacterized protein n=1 Tax=Elysia crispata TaxID=231223 RepID=A0AAE0Z4Y2_9GAST|nr:hypothetical protein RRG08_040495 [Elysia crispata]
MADTMNAVLLIFLLISSFIPGVAAFDAGDAIALVLGLHFTSRQSDILTSTCTVAYKVSCGLRSQGV